MQRRTFLKLSALAGVSLQASKIESIKETIFDNKKELVSDRFGPFYANMNSSKIVSVTPFEGDKFPNTMNNCVPDRIQNESRVLYPCVRKSYLEKKGPSNSSRRGADEFVRVSWDTALDLAAKALKENFDNYGPEAIYGECYWWGGWGKVSWGRTVAHRMLKILGGYVEESGDYSTGAGMVILPHIFGSNTVYEAPTTWKAILKNAKNVVFWGTDPIVTNQIAVGTPTHTNYEYFTKLKEASRAGKIKVYSVDVYENNTARYLNTDLISVRPNTDTAMMIGMCCYLYESGKYAKEFIKKYTVGFNKFKQYFMGENDGVKKDLAWASKICGVSEEELKKFADDLVQEKTIIIAGRALQRQDHGEQTHWMITILSTMLGHIGKEGCGFEFGLGYNALGADRYIAPRLKGISSIPSVGDENSPWVKHKNITIPSSRSIDAMLNPGKVIEQNGKKIKLPHIRVAYNASGSFFTRHPGTNRALEGFKKVDTIITAEPFWTSQAKLSDIVLPVALEPERYDIEASSNGEYIFLNKPIIEPMGESRSDFWICREICKRWGLEEVFTEGKKDELEWMKDIYADASKDAKGLGYTMPSFDDALKQGYVRFDKVNKDIEYYTRLSDFVKNPHKHRLGTPSGKIEIFSPVIDAMGYDDCFGHPAWFEPFEWLGDDDISKKYPLAVVSPHSRFRLHSQLNNSIIRNYAEIGGREPMIIHPLTAEKRGIKTGDIVRVYNGRGEILAGALVSDIVREDTIIICEGAWYDPEVWGRKSLCQHGCVNVLTRDKGTSKLAQSNTAHTTLAEVEKYKGVIKPLTAFSKPRIIQGKY